ncbi:MAG: lipocalin family protein [Bacteroidota bacterium]
MKRIYFFLTALIISGIFVLSGCGDDESEMSVTNADLLAGTTSKQWTLTNVAITGAGSGAPDPCTGDDIFTFFRNGNYTQDDATIKCDPDDVQLINGTYEFNSDMTAYTLTIGGLLAIDYTIVELTATRLVVDYNFIFDIRETYEAR